MAHQSAGGAFGIGDKCSSGHKHAEIICVKSGCFSNFQLQVDFKKIAWRVYKKSRSHFCERLHFMRCPVVCKTNALNC